MHGMRLPLWALVVIVFASPPPKHGFGTLGDDRIYYVSVRGIDASAVPGDSTRPFRSPRGAYSAMPDNLTTGTGDHIILLTDDGVYGQLRMTPKRTDAAHRIVLRAAAGAAPTMDAYGTADGSPGRGIDNPALRVDASHVVVEGLRFINTSLDTSVGRDCGGSEVMVRLDGSHVAIIDNFFDGWPREPTITDMFLLICDTAADNLVAGNRFNFSGGKGLIYIGSVCTGRSPGRQVIRNNVLSRFGNKPQAICAAINFGGSEGTFAGNNSVVENNTVYDNGGRYGGGCWGLLNTNSSALTVRNNIFANITGSRYAVGCRMAPGRSTGIVANSLMYGNTNDVEPGCWTLVDHRSANPHFVAPDANPPDLHVQSTTGSRRSDRPGWSLDSHCSPAIDAAAASDTYEREPSPNGARRNLGAYGNTPEASKSCVP